MEESVPPRVPETIVVEREISGEIRGQKLSSPSGLVVNRLGEIFLTDTRNHRLLKFDSTFNPTKQIGGFGGGTNLFNEPTFITFDNQLNLLVCDGRNRRIVRYTTDLVYVESIEFEDPSDPLQFGSPSGLAVTRYGEVWVGDAERDRIAVFNNVGKFDRFIGDFGDASGQLASPEKIIQLSTGEFLVCDAGNRRLVLFDQYGRFHRDITHPQLDYPMAAAASGNGLWVIDSNRRQLFLLDRSGNLLFSLGPVLTGSSTSLIAPTDVVPVGDDRLLICDSGSNRLLLCRVLYGEE